MKFLVTKDLAHSKLLGYLMGSVLFVIFIYILLDIVLHSYVIGLDMDTVKSTLFGNIETFEEPILIDSLLLQVHIDLFMTLFSLLILSSIYIRIFSEAKATKWIVHTLFLFGVFTPLLLLVAYFWSEWFVYVWLISFFIWHLLALVLSVMTFKRLIFR